MKLTLRKIVAALIAVSLLTFVTACGGDAPIESSAPPVESAEILPEAPMTATESSDSEAAELSEMEVEFNHSFYAVDEIPVPLISVEKTEDGKYNLTVRFTDQEQGNIRDFGIYVVVTQNIFETTYAIEERGNITVSLLMEIGDGEGSIITFEGAEYESTTTGLHGNILDDRSGEVEITVISSIDDLCDAFPLTLEYISKQDIDPNDVAIYEAVMAELNRQPSRPENEIFAELAPQYNMTAEELRDFMRDMMERVY